MEFDVAGGMKAAAEEMGETQPVTRAQRSGRGFGHYIFRHTDRSRALGNRSVNLSDGNEWFSFRGSNKYLVGAGSLHPSGNYYKTVADVDPTPVPDWVCDFVEKHSEVPKPKQTSGAADVSEDFDFDGFLDVYGIGGHQDGDWYIADECPVAGYRHRGSTKTGFFFDGNSLGFHCFAQGCEGSRMTVGQVIGFLNKEKGECYKGVIWEQDDSDLEGVVDVTDEDEELPEPVPVPETKKIIEDLESVFNDQPPAEESAQQMSSLWTSPTSSDRRTGTPRDTRQDEVCRRTGSDQGSAERTRR